MKSRERLARFQNVIWDYYGKHGRDLPWRKSITPYRVLVSEVMLQQTQVDRVVPKFREFLRKFPSFQKLAKASRRDVLATWQGLGYNRRALMAQKLASVVYFEYGGRLPRDAELLVRLPGIGKATAGAILAFAFNAPAVFIETNIRRAFLHFFFPRENKVRDAEIEPLVAAAVDGKRPREWYYALMDYGAMLGRWTARNPNRRSAHYVRQPPFRGSDREARGKIIRLLLSEKSCRAEQIVSALEEPLGRVEKILLSLQRDGFVELREGRYRLAP